MKTLQKLIFIPLLFAFYGCAVKPIESPTSTSTPSPTSTPKPICPLCFFVAPTPQQQPTSSVNLISKDGQYFLLIEDRKVSSLLTTRKATVENCSGITDIAQSFNFSQAFTSAVEVGVDNSISAGIKDIIQFSVATHYSLNLSETKTYEMNTNFIAPPGYRVIYTVEWYDVWVEGRIIPVDKLQSGEKEEISYRAKTGLESRIPNPIPEACAPTPTDIPTSSPMPTLEPTHTPTLTLVVPTQNETPTVELTMTSTPTPTP